MKVIIAGGRNHQFTDDDIVWLDVLKDRIPITEAVSGCARGADTCGEEWAERRGIPVMRFPADWDELGPKAGPIRNGWMADYADALVAFPGGSGTRNMIAQATEKGLQIHLRDSYEAFRAIMDARDWKVGGDSGPVLDFSPLKHLGPFLGLEEASEPNWRAGAVRRMQKKDPEAAEALHREFLEGMTRKQRTAYLRALKRRK